MGNPADSTSSTSLYLYLNAFRYGEMGYAAAMAWVLFVITFVLALVIFRWSRRWVHYETIVTGGRRWPVSSQRRGTARSVETGDCASADWRNRRSGNSGVPRIVLIPLCALYLLPLYWMVATALKPTRNWAPIPRPLAARTRVVRTSSDAVDVFPFWTVPPEHVDHHRLYRASAR